MQLGYIPGVWDLLHVGHVAILRRAKGFCERLVVGVPADDVVIEDKNKPPAITLEHRVELLQELRCVDVVLPYYKLEFLNPLNFSSTAIFICGGNVGVPT